MGVCPAAYFTIFASALSAEKALCCTTTVSLELREGAGYTLELPYLMQMNAGESLSALDQVSQKKILAANIGNTGMESRMCFLHFT